MNSITLILEKVKGFECWLGKGKSGGKSDGVDIFGSLEESSTLKISKGH